jgi:hypothetical protein
VCGIGIGRAANRGRLRLYEDELRWIAPDATPGPARVGLREVARERLVLTVGSCGLAGATRALFAAARLPIVEYAGHALGYAVLEEWAELGIGGAIVPAAHIRRATSAALVVDGQPARLAYEAVWRQALRALPADGRAAAGPRRRGRVGPAQRASRQRRTASSSSSGGHGFWRNSWPRPSCSSRPARSAL